MAAWALGALVLGRGCVCKAAPRLDAPGCRTASFEGELEAGKSFTKPIGNGLAVWFQPIASGWILRVIPARGPLGEHDYAELATPPYRSVTPLSLSTDFSFRAQDAVGWNPRRFRFSTSAGEFERLRAVYGRYVGAGATPPFPLEVELSEQVSKAQEGTLTLLDARLIPGTADQWRMAATVASHFTTTAHTLFDPGAGGASALGKLLWVRFRMQLELPRGFSSAPGIKVVPRVCAVV